MKAIAFEKYGVSDMLKLRKVAKPTPKDTPLPT